MLIEWLCVGGNDYGPIISYLNRYKHIFKNNNLLADLSLGLWSAVGSSQLLEALVSYINIKQIFTSVVYFGRAWGGGHSFL